MTFFSAADACHRLGIDAKTLRRWLAEAQLSLHTHPEDGRKKGVSGEHLRQLAQLHQRSLRPLPSEPQEQTPDPLPLLPASLLALPETIAALQAQITTLQQHVTELTTLLQSHVDQPAGLKTPARSLKEAKPPLTPASSVRRARAPVPSSATSSRKRKQVIPLVEYGKEGRYVIICPKRGILPFEPDTPEWFAWVEEQSSFRFVGKFGHFSAHHWWRVPHGAWRAHRQIRNHSYNLRLAPSQDLTIAVLEQAAAALQAHLA